MKLLKIGDLLTMFFFRGGGGGGGGVIKKFKRGGPPPKDKPLTLLNTIYDGKGIPLYTFYDRWYSFHIPGIQLCIP